MFDVEYKVAGQTLTGQFEAGSESIPQIVKSIVSEIDSNFSDTEPIAAMEKTLVQNLHLECWLAGSNNTTLVDWDRVNNVLSIISDINGIWATAIYYYLCDAYLDWCATQ